MHSFCEEIPAYESGRTEMYNLEAFASDLHMHIFIEDKDGHSIYPCCKNWKFWGLLLTYIDSV